MSKSFAAQLKRFGITSRAKVQTAFLRCTEEVGKSVVSGSEITGAPGQPVDTGNLRASWIGEFDGPAKWGLSTNVEYAPFVEDNDRGVTFKTGGPHSVALTVLGWDRIVEHVAKEVGPDERGGGVGARVRRNGPIVTAGALVPA